MIYIQGFKTNTLKYKLCFAVLVTTQLLTLCNKLYGYAQPTSVLQTREPGAQVLDTFYSISKVKLFSRTRMFLTIDENGKVGGTINCSSPYTNLEMASVGWNLVRIKGATSGQYLAMNANGNIYSSTIANDETVFKHRYNKAFESFASHKYYRNSFYDSFLGIRKNGKIKHGRKTKLSQKTVQFLTVQSDTNQC